MNQKHFSINYGTITRKSNGNSFWKWVAIAREKAFPSDLVPYAWVPDRGKSS